jgi:predicted P-loop ATPase/5S rRNA maturation endonuclease (ribonuclease M5)
MNGINRLLTLLNEVKGSENQYTALCPAHDDKKASLSIAYKNSRILLNCFAGCETEAIITALGLEMKDLFDEKPEYNPKAKEIVYNYTDEKNKLLYIKKRFDQSDGSKFFGFYTPNGKKGIGRTPHVPYRLHKLAETTTIYIVEGEKCVHAIEKAGFIATTLDAGAQSPWRKHYTPYFEEKRVIILPDNDDAGLTYALNIKKALPHAVIKKLPNLPDKGDIYDWLEQGHTMAEINELPDFDEYIPPGRSKTKKEKAKREFSPEEQDILDKIIERYDVYDDEKLTISGVALYLEQNGISVKYNEITRKINTKGLEKWDNDYITGNLPIIIYNKLNLLYKKCTMNVVQDFLKVITMQNAYNPVLETLDSGKWDGVDRLPELYAIMRIDDSDKLSKTLIHKWLWQNLSMLRNKKDDNFGADGLLVLKGEQGIGKTSFARKMALNDDFFGESLTLDIRDKDTVLRAISCWIGELGEIESTFKSDINAIKGFITLSTDKVRVPYGREADDIPRRTSFIGTCNSDEYLIDETGNRRYWTVPINERIDLDSLDKLDALQLYLQVNEQAKDNIQGFRLTWEENQQLSKRNGRHEKLLKGEQEIKDILYKAERDDLNFEEMTVTEFKELYSVLRNYPVNQISSALKKHGIIIELKRKDGQPQRLASLPRPKYRLDFKDFN